MLAPAPSGKFFARSSVRVGTVVLLALWAAYQCLWNPRGQNVAGDEYIYVTAGWRYVHGDFGTNLEHPPTAKYLFGVAQLFAGPGTLGPRLLVGTMVLAGGVVLLLWLRLAVGWWVGLAAAAAWWLTPRGGAGLRIDRTAMLDPVMTFFALAALAAAWMWVSRGRTWWMPLSAVLMALSVTSKVSTLVLLPAFIALPLLYRRRSYVTSGAPLWILVFVTTVAVTYAPLGIADAVGYMLAFQGEHNADGHTIAIGRHVYQFAPWWANLWFMQRGIGVVVFATIAVGVIAAVLLRPDRLVAFLAIVVGLLAVFYLGISRVALGGYYYVFMPFLIALCAIGYGRLVDRLPAVATRAVVLVTCVALATPALVLSHGIWRVRPSAIARVPAILRDEGVGPRERVLFIGCPASTYGPYLHERGTTDPRGGPFGAIVEGKDARGSSASFVREWIAERPEHFERHPTGGLVVWIPDGIVSVDADGEKVSVR